MNRRSTHLLVGFLVLSVVGCNGGAQLVLKSPIRDQCNASGLKGCEQIADGATLYADGKEAEGEQQLGAGLRANAGKITELKRFADGLALVGNVPGAGPYVAPMQPAIRLVQRVAAEAAQQEAQLKASAPAIPEAGGQLPVAASQVLPKGTGDQKVETREVVPAVALMQRSPTQTRF